MRDQKILSNVNPSSLALEIVSLSHCGFANQILFFLKRLDELDLRDIEGFRLCVQFQMQSDEWERGEFDLLPDLLTILLGDAHLDLSTSAHDPIKHEISRRGAKAQVSYLETPSLSWIRELDSATNKVDLVSSCYESSAKICLKRFQFSSSLT
jgi:hypothetical protein